MLKLLFLLLRVQVSKVFSVTPWFGQNIVQAVEYHRPAPSAVTAEPSKVVFLSGLESLKILLCMLSLLTGIPPARLLLSRFHASSFFPTPLQT